MVGSYAMHSHMNAEGVIGILMIGILIGLVIGILIGCVAVHSWRTSFGRARVEKQKADAYAHPDHAGWDGARAAYPRPPGIYQRRVRDPALNHGLADW
eukprot:13247343-Heterocapsa_arctica.AAC.1